jgi:hypothetical protein
MDLNETSELLRNRFNNQQESIVKFKKLKYKTYRKYYVIYKQFSDLN